MDNNEITDKIGNKLFFCFFFFFSFAENSAFMNPKLAVCIHPPLFAIVSTGGGIILLVVFPNIQPRTLLRLIFEPKRHDVFE